MYSDKLLIFMGIYEQQLVFLCISTKFREEGLGIVMFKVLPKNKTLILKHEKSAYEKKRVHM